MSVRHKTLVAMIVFMFLLVGYAGATTLQQDDIPGPLPPLQVITAENAAGLEELRRFEIPNFAQMHETCGVDFNPDGTMLAGVCMSDTVSLWDVENGNVLYEFRKPGNIFASVAFSPDGETLAAAGQGSSFYFWDVATGESQQLSTSAAGYTSVLEFSPDGQLFVAGSFSGQATLWEVATGSRAASFFGHGSRINSVAFSPDGERIVSGGGDNMARLWDTAGQELLVLEGANHFVEDVEFSPDGLQIAGASDDRRVRVWDADQSSPTFGEVLHEFSGHNNSVNGVTYSPDGNLLASTSNDRSLQLWDMDEASSTYGEQVAQVIAHSDLAIRAAFNPNGTLIASVGWDGTVALWGVPPTPSPTGTPAPSPEPAETEDESAGTILLIFGNRFIYDIYEVVLPAFEGAGYNVVFASDTMNPRNAKNSNQQVQPDLLLEDVWVEDYEAIVFVCDNDFAFGGSRANTSRIAQDAVEQERIVAAICAAPMILGYADVVEGLEITAEPSNTCQTLESRYGATCTNASVQRDGLIITARDRYSSRSFARAIIDAIEEQ